MLRQIGYTFLVLTVILTGFFATRLPLPNQPTQPTPLEPDCSLLDDPQAAAMMSATSEWILRYHCEQAEGVGPLPGTGEPSPAEVPPVGADVRVNAVDPPAASTIQSETTIAANENNGTLCAAFNDSYHFPDEGLAGFSRSSDRGATWQDGGPFPSSPNGVTWGDPVLVWRRVDGYFYYIGMLADYGGVGLWRSTDDCASFQWFDFIHIGTQDDKPFAAVDNNPTSPYYGRFYVAWTDLGTSPRRISFTYSDDGLSWTAPIPLSTPGETTTGVWPAVAPNGDLYMVWLNWVYYVTTISIEGARSTDGGNTFIRIANPLTEAVAPRDLEATSNCGRPALHANASDGIRYYTLPQIAVGPDGCLHVTYSYDPDGYNVGDVIDSYYRRSCDDGASWEPEVRLNDDDTLTDQFFPAITVSQDNIIVASWYDRRLDPANNYLLDRYWTVSYDGGTTWEPNARITDQSSPIYTSSCYHGDYDQLATSGDDIYHIWSDDRIYFNGHFDPDVWFDRATVTPDFFLAAAPLSHTTCAPAVLTSTITVGAVKGYDEPVTLSDSGAPAGVQTAFSVNPVTPPGTSTYVITATAAAPPGNYDLLVSGQTPTRSRQLTITLAISDCCEPVTNTRFVWQPLTPTVGQVVTFTAAASGSEPISFRWAFGDGDGAEGGALVTHTYTLSGVYGVQLTASNACGEVVVQHPLTVAPAPPPSYEIYLPLVWKEGSGDNRGSGF